MARLLLEKELIKEFKNKIEFTTSDVRVFYQKQQKDIKNSTVNWKIYHLVKEGVIVRMKIGVYNIKLKK
jgi:hypothetical protein